MDNLFLAYFLIIIGLFLMSIELILFSGGILFVLAVGAIICGVAMTFASGTMVGVITLLVLIVVIPLLVTAIFQLGPKTPWGSKIFLNSPDDDQNFANRKVNLDLEHLRGRVGKTMCPLRPAGITDFDGKRVDTITEGLLVDEGEWVKCIDIKEGRVIVRRVDGPPDLANMNLT